MEFEQPKEGEDKCHIGNGDPLDGKDEPCRAKNNVYQGVRDNPLCIFPFLYNGKRYEECLVITLFDWVYLPRCPVRRRVKNGTYNSYDDTDVLFGIGDSGSYTKDYILKLNLNIANFLFRLHSWF